MKKLIVYDHNGIKLLEQEVFVEGQDFQWQSPTPRAFWLGKIVIVDKEPEPEPKVEGPILQDDLIEITRDSEPEPINVEIEEANIAMVYQLSKEVKDESETTDNQGVGDTGVSEDVESESIERVPKQSAGGQTRKRSRKSRKSKAA